MTEQTLALEPMVTSHKFARDLVVGDVLALAVNDGAQSRPSVFFETVLETRRLPSTTSNDVMVTTVTRIPSRNPVRTLHIFRPYEYLVVLP